MRQALQYQRLAGGVLALHEEDPALSGEGVMHEGAVSALLGLAGIPSISECTMIERDAALAALRGRPRSTSCTSPPRESVEAVERAKAAGRRRSPREVTPHHLLAHRRGRALARPALQDEPAAARRGATARR